MLHFDVSELDGELVRGPSHVARGAAAVPDVPASVGTMVAGVYASLVSILFLAIANQGEASFAIAIDVVFLIAFFTVPILFLKLEADPARRPRLSRFLAQGLDTATGHCSGRSALVQMFVVPVLLNIAVAAIGLIAQVTQ